MLSLKQLENNLDKILIENVSSGDFNKPSFQQKLEFFLDFVTEKFPCFADRPRTLVQELIKSKVTSLTSAGFCRNGRIPIPSPKRIWVTTFYAHLMLGKIFFSQVSIAEWLAETWPELQIPSGALDETFALLKEYTGVGKKERGRGLIQTLSQTKDQR